VNTDNPHQPDQAVSYLLEELEQSPVIGVYLTDLNGKILFSNQAFAKFLGWDSPQDLIGRKAVEFYVLPEDRSGLVESLNRYGSVSNYEINIRDRSGDIKIILLQASVRGSVITGIATDVTREKGYQAALEEQRRRYKLATTASDIGIWDWNIPANKIYFSSTWKSQLGYTPEELPNEFETWQGLMHPDDYERVYQSLYRFLDHPGPFFEIEFRLRHKNGTYRWIRNRAASLVDSSGKTYRMLGAHTDITERKKSQDQLLKLERAVWQSPVAIAITSKSGQIEFVNPKFCELTGYPLEEVLGKNPSILNSGHHKKVFFKKLWSTILSGKTWYGKFHNKRKDGSLVIEKASISPVLNTAGEITHFVKIAEDITNQVRLERELRDAKAKAEVANIYKNNFLANMSHEIRTPMNGIVGFAELLKEPDISTEEQSKYIRIINDNCGVLLNLIDDIIDVSKIEANEIKLQISQFSVKQLISELGDFYRTYRRNINRSGVEILTSTPEYSHPEFIETDHYRLRQVLTNLISNALKFCHQGFVEFGYNLFNDQFIQFYVKDTGIGIAPDKINIIFERFRQTDESITRKYGGTGLGLSISQGLVHLLGGDIWVESKQGLGSVFSFRIPYTPVSFPELDPVLLRQPDSEVSLKGVHFLIVEDVEYNYQYLKEVLRKQGARVSRASTGGQAVTQAINQIPDIILMDIQLPEMNGYEAIKRIREFNPDIPIIPQTAYAFAEEKEKCFALGCTDYLVKPVRLRELFSTISKYL